MISAKNWKLFFIQDSDEIHPVPPKMVSQTGEHWYLGCHCRASDNVQPALLRNSVAFYLTLKLKGEESKQVQQVFTCLVGSTSHNLFQKEFQAAYIKVHKTQAESMH